MLPARRTRHLSAPWPHLSLLAESRMLCWKRCMYSLLLLISRASATDSKGEWVTRNLHSNDYYLASLRVRKRGWEKRTILTFAGPMPWAKPDFPVRKLRNVIFSLVMGVHIHSV